MLKIKEESEVEEVDIGPTILQYQDSHYTTNQQVVSVVKLESELDATLYDGVKQESNAIQLTGMGGVRCAQASSAPVGDGSMKQGIQIAVEGTNLVIGPITLQQRTNQQNTSVVKMENTIVCDDNDPLLCSGEKEESDTCGESSRYTCDYCPKTFIYIKNLQLHVKCMHASCYFTCDQCGKFYKCKPYLTSHMRRMHGDKQLQCKVCGEIVNSWYYYWQHKQGHRRVIGSMKSSEKRSMKSSKKHSMKSSRKLSMKSPKKQSMKSSEKRSVSYKCVKCVQIFHSNCMFRQHYKLTHSIETHKYKKCNKEFLLETFFRLRTTHSDVLFECAICNKIYISRPCLSKHVSEDHLPGFTEYQQPVQNGEGAHHPVGDVHAAGCNSSAQRQDYFDMMEALASKGLVLGPVPLPRMDCNCQPNREDPLLDPRSYFVTITY